jgi:ATP-dependent Lon protease
MNCYVWSFVTPLTRSVGRSSFQMQFYFDEEQGSMKSAGGIGNQGEYYYIQGKNPSLEAPSEALGDEEIIPIYLRNNVLVPLGKEHLGVYEMRYRQLIYDVGDNGYFGYSFYSQEVAKLALVGTLARIRKVERLEDGGQYVFMEGYQRFYIQELVSDKPYLKARIQYYYDYTKYTSAEELEKLGQQLLDELRYSVKLMRILYPQNNYTLNEDVLRFRPLYTEPGVRRVRTVPTRTIVNKLSGFSYAAMELLRTEPVTKLAFLQEPIIEKRLWKMIEVSNAIIIIIPLNTHYYYYCYYYY